MDNNANNDQPSKEFQDLVKKAKTYGINVEAIIGEVNRLIQAKTMDIARFVIDQIPGQKIDIEELADKVAGKVHTASIDIEELADKVAGKVQTASIDIDALAEKVKGKLPEQIGIDVDGIKKEIAGIAVQAINTAHEEDKEIIARNVEAVFMQYKDDMVAGVRKEFQQRMEEMRDMIKAGPGEEKPDKWERFMPLFEKIIEKTGENQDPLANLQQLVKLREQLSVFDSPGPSADTLFRANQSVLMEGIKIGAKAKQEGTIKNSLSPSGGALTKPARSSSKISPAISKI